MRIASFGGDLLCPRRRAGKDRKTLSRRPIHNGHDGSDPDWRIFRARKSLDRNLPPHRHISCAGDFRSARRRAGWRAPVSAAFVRDRGDAGARHHRARGVAVRADFRLFAARGARRRRLHPVSDRSLFLSQGPCPKPAGRRGLDLRPGGSRRAVRRQLPVVFPVCSRAGRAGHAAARQITRSARTRFAIWRISTPIPIWSPAWPSFGWRCGCSPRR